LNAFCEDETDVTWIIGRLLEWPEGGAEFVGAL
jgi:hypothetical protein